MPQQTNLGRLAALKRVDEDSLRAACQKTFKAGRRIVKVVVLYCTTPKNGILIAAPRRKMKNFKMGYSVK